MKEYIFEVYSDTESLQYIIIPASLSATGPQLLL